MKDQDNNRDDRQSEQNGASGAEQAAEKAIDAEAEQAAQAQQSDAEQPISDVDKLQAELRKYQELSLRVQAEADNLRKRLERDFEKRRQFALESFMRDLIGVRDSLERGLDASQAGADGSQAETVTPLREGMEMTLKQLDKVLNDNGLSVVDPLGEAFNPDRHEAVTMQPSSEQEPNTVLQVIQKGYCLHDRLLRPAMVIVAKAPD